MTHKTVDPRAVLFALLGLMWCVALGLFLSHNRILSLSGDTAFHVQAMEMVRRAFLVPASANDWMPEMYPYPKLSHRLAGLAMEFGLRPVAALSFVATACAGLVWLLLLDQVRRVSSWVLLAASILTIGNIVFSGAAFGAEVIHNFFYPQIVAEAVCVASLLGGGFLLTRSRWGFIAWSVATVVLVAFFHQVPALKLAGAFMALLGVEFLRRAVAERRIDWTAIIGAVAIGAAVLGNPFFWTMRRLAANNGAATFHAPLPLWQLGAVAGILAALSAWVLIAEALEAVPAGSRRRAMTLLAALGAATAAALLAQLLLLVLSGEGSEYAVRKHAPGVFAMLALVAPAFVFQRVSRLGEETDPGATTRRIAIAGLLVAQVVVMFQLFWRPTLLDVAHVDELLTDARRVRLERGLHGDGVMFASGQERPVVNFIATLGMLQARMKGDTLSVLGTGHPAYPEELKAIVTPLGDPYDRAGCRQGPPMGSLVIVDPNCASIPAIWFSTGGAGIPDLVAGGWSDPEKGGIWSIKQRAVINVPLSPADRGMKAAWLQINAFAFLPEQSPARRVTVSVAGALPETFLFTRAEAMAHTFAIRLGPESLSNPTLQITFDIPDAVSPAALGLGDDPRTLGVGVERLRILPRGEGF